MGRDHLDVARQRYVQALAAADRDAAEAVVDELMSEGIDPRTIYLRILCPALVAIGELWQQAKITIAQEHLATAFTTAIMARLVIRLGAADPLGRKVILACTAGELHCVGTRVVADFLEADGWEVLDLGAATPARDLVALVREQRPDVVGISTTLSLHLEGTRDAIAGLREAAGAPFILVGGQAYADDPELAERIGADGFAADAETARRLLRERFAE